MEHMTRRTFIQSAGALAAGTAAGGLTFARHEFVGFLPGARVVLEDGRPGTLKNPRGCYCGPHGEACWDIALDEVGGVQAYGGTFRLLDKGKHESAQR